MEQTNLDSTALGITNPYEYVPPLQTLYRSHNSTKKATSLSPKEKAKKRRAKRKAQRHNR
jgi:hypothetical protein